MDEKREIRYWMWIFIFLASYDLAQDSTITAIGSLNRCIFKLLLRNRRYAFNIYSFVNYCLEIYSLL
jgi:hypothetical protein